MNKPDYGIRRPDLVDKYFNNPTTLGHMMDKIVALGLRYYVDCLGEPMLHYGGKWMGYKEVSKLDKRLEVNGL